jgi:hypothetical protein
VFRKNYKDRHGRTRKSETWFLKFYVNGSPVEKSTGTTDYNEAVILLRKKIADVANKTYAHTEDPDKVTVNQLLDLVVEDYRDNKRNTTYDTQKRIDKHLRPFFGQKRYLILAQSCSKNIGTSGTPRVMRKPRSTKN